MAGQVRRWQATGGVLTHQVLKQWRYGAAAVGGGCRSGGVSDRLERTPA